MATDSRPFWILGAQGQLGQAWLAMLKAERRPARAFARDELDLENPSHLANFGRDLRELPASERPLALVLTAAYTQVDHAERPEERARAEKINATAPALIAKTAAEVGIPLIHYSTDYVYEGSGHSPRSENAPVAPLNVYGQSKLAGDLGVARAFEGTATPWLVLRTSWVYDANGKNFFRTMIRLFQEKERLTIVNDQWGAPSFAPHLARASLQAFEALTRSPEMQKRSGVYHLVHRGETTWHGFAQAILRHAEKALPIKVRELGGIPSAEYPTPARRPLNSRLSCEKLKSQLGVELPPWEAGLAECWQAWQETHFTSGNRP